MTEPDEESVVPGDHVEPDERDIEASAEDVVEQTIPANPAEQPSDVQRGLEVGEYDALEQARVIDLDPDNDYR